MSFLLKVRWDSCLNFKMNRISTDQSRISREGYQERRLVIDGWPGQICTRRQKQKKHRRHHYLWHIHLGLIGISCKPDTCTTRAAALGQKNPQNYFKEKSTLMSLGRYLCIVYIKLRVKKQNSIDSIIIVKRKPNFTILITKNYFK